MNDVQLFMTIHVLSRNCVLKTKSNVGEKGVVTLTV